MSLCYVFMSLGLVQGSGKQASECTMQAVNLRHLDIGEGKCQNFYTVKEAGLLFFTLASPALQGPSLGGLVMSSYYECIALTLSSVPPEPHPGHFCFATDV